MSKNESALNEIHFIDELNDIHSFVRECSPLSKLFITILYLLLVISTNKYNLEKTIILILYPIIIYCISNIKMIVCFSKLRYILPILIFVGIFNPLLDKQIIYPYGISGGVISMITLMLKGIYCLLASFILIATTSIEELCLALRKIKCPKILVSLFLLTFRYITVLLEEVDIMLTSYKLRAPNQNGLHISTWGSFLGQLLLRTIDKADMLYQSMLLRGYDGEFYYIDNNYSKEKTYKLLVIMMLLFVFLYNYNFIVVKIGGLF